MPGGSGSRRISSRTQLITQNSGLQALYSRESAKNQCVINSVQLLIETSDNLPPRPYPPVYQDRQ